MNDNNIRVSHFESVNSNSTQTSITQSRILCEYIRSRKFMWIIFSSIIVILIILKITIPTTIIIRRKIKKSDITSTTTNKIYINTKWKQNANTIAGSTATYGRELNELKYPESICINKNKKSIYISDTGNQRITEWKFGASYADVVAYDIERESDVGIYYRPIDMIVDENDDSLIICDLGNERVKRWSPRNSSNIQTIITNIACTGLAVDRNGDVYVSDKWAQKVSRWRQTDMSETIVAGGNRRGSNLNQLHSPSRIAVDRDLSVYVADANNHRVMKWMKDAEDGLVVAGGHGEGNKLSQLSFPLGIIVDHLGNIFVADTGNDRIMYWSADAKEGVIVAGGNDRGYKENQLSLPSDLTFDQEGHLYVIDTYNHRVQRFSVDSNVIY